MDEKALYWLKAVLAVVLIALGIAWISYLRGANSSRNQVSITGTGEYSAVPDLAVLIMSIRTEDDSASSAQSANKEKMDDVVGFVKEAGIPEADIKMTSYRVSPNYAPGECELPEPVMMDYSYENTRVNSIMMPCDEPEIDGYEALARYEIKVRDDSAIDALVEGVVEHGADEITNISYTFDDEDKVRDEARKLALLDAKKKIKILEETTGLRLGKLISYYEDSYPYGKEMMYDSYYGMGGDGMGRSITPGESEVTINVNLVYQVK